MANGHWPCFNAKLTDNNERPTLYLNQSLWSELNKNYLGSEWSTQKKRVIAVGRFWTDFIWHALVKISAVFLLGLEATIVTILPKNFDI